MKEHVFLPKPIFPRLVCFPDFVGRYKSAADHIVKRGYKTTELNLHKYYNLHWIRSGKGYVESDGVTYELSGTDGFLYGPGVAQHYYADPHDPWDVAWVHFFGEHLEAFLEGRGIGGVWIFSCANGLYLNELFDELLNLSRQYKVQDEARLSSQLYEILVHLQHNAFKLHNTSLNLTENMHRAANYIRKHYKEPLMLEQLAKVAGYSSSYFNRKFHDHYGRTPIEFVTETRLLNAKRLLLFTQLTIKQIALESGFSQSSYFISRFRKSEGMTPEQFRNRNLSIF